MLTTQDMPGAARTAARVERVVVRPFYLDGKVQDAGTKLQLTKAQAAEFGGAGKVLPPDAAADVLAEQAKAKAKPSKEK